MKALSGVPADLAIQALTAGCDLALYCAGEFEPTAALLSRCPPVSGLAAQRLERARTKAARGCLSLNIDALARERDRSTT